MNILLATPDELWALRYPETHDLLWLDEREAQAPEHVDRRRRLRYGVDVPAPGIGVASEAMGGRRAAWTPLGPGELLHVVARPRRRPSRRIIDEPPAHPLTLDDLTGHAAAAQAEK